MLNKDEELRAKISLEMFKKDIADGIDVAADYKMIALLWLAEKLLEINEELSKVTAELYKVKDDFANYVESRE